MFECWVRDHPFSSYAKCFEKLTFLTHWHCTKIKFSIKDFFSKWYHIRRQLRIWSQLLKKSLMENFFFVQCDKHTEKSYIRTAPYLSVFSPNVGKYGTKKFRVRTLFRQWYIFFMKTCHTRICIYFAKMKPFTSHRRT